MLQINHCSYNMDTGCVETVFSDGSLLAIDCAGVEIAYDVSKFQQVDLDWLIYNKPKEYVRLVLTGEIADYIQGPTLHGLEDCPK